MGKTLNDIAVPGTIDAGNAAEVRDAELLAQFGYKQELKRRLGFFPDFAIAFTYISPVVGVYALFTLGLGSGGPAYIWLMPIVLLGQLLVALIFAEVGSTYPLAGALYQWAKNLLGVRYGWAVGWTYTWALLATVAAIDTGVAGYASPLLNDVFKTNLNPADPNVILVFTFIVLIVQTFFNAVGVRYTAWITNVGVAVEVIGTVGLALALFAVGFHHGLDYLFTTQGTENLKTNPLGVNYGGNWLFGAALVAILSHVWIFYGFESAGDVGEEVIDASRVVPRAIWTSLLFAGFVSFILVAALMLAIPSGGFSKAGSLAGGIPYIISANLTSHIVQDFFLLCVTYAFFSAGTAVQASATRLIYSFSRDGALPASSFLSRVSLRFHTPVNALLVATIIPALFSLLVHTTPSKPITVGFITYPANVNALFVLVSFGVSGIYIGFQMVILASLVARIRGWRPQGPFQLGRWAIPINIGALVYGIVMIVNVMLPSGLNSPRAQLFNYDWMTILVAFVIALLGLIYYLIDRPDRRVQENLESRRGVDEPGAREIGLHSTR